MEILAVVCLILLVMPFLLGYIHTSANKRTPATVLYYRYFVAFNLMFSGLFVTTRMFVNGPAAAAVSGWAYSPIFQLYGVAILSMVILGLVAVLSRKSIMLAPGILWATFLILSSLLFIEQISQHQIAAMDIILVHIVYSLIVAGCLLRFVVKLRPFIRESRAASAEVATSLHSSQ